MQYVGQTLCISHAELTDPVNGFLKADTLGYYQKSKRITQVQKGGNGREALFAVDSLPLKYKNEVYKRNPDLQKTARALPFAESITTDGEAYNYFSNYKLDDGKNLPTDIIEEYTLNASILNRFAEMIDRANSHRGRLGDRRVSVTAFWNDKAAILPLITDKLKHTLPTHPRRLQAKYREYRRNGYEVLISKKYANRNAAKISDPEQEAVLIRLLGDHRNWDNERVAELYNFIASKMSAPDKWQPLTGRAVGYLRQKYDLITTAARRGTGEFYNNKVMQVKRSAPTAPLLYWTADGWDVELFYQKTTENKNGHRVTTYTNRVTLVVILDAFNKYPIGYAIGDHETPELIKAALQNAANHTRELFGTRYRANQFQSDRYAIKKMTPIYSAISKAVTPARAHNAKAKIIEPYFGYLNKKYCQLLPNWSGFGITSNKNKQPNSELQNKIRHQFPDLGGVIDQITKIMEMERNSKRADYLKAFETLASEYLLPLSTENYLLTFGADTGRRNAIEGVGLRPTIEGVKRDFDCFNPTFRNYSHVKWSIRYDPADLSQALAVSEDGTLRFMLESKHVQPMALADRKAGDAAALKRINQFNHEITADVVEQYSLADGTTQQLILENPNLRNTLAKTLICNSLGQHKDERNAVRHQIESGAPAARAKRKERVTIEVPCIDDIVLAKIPDRRETVEDENTYDLY